MVSKPDLSANSFAILALLEDLGEASSYDLKQAARSLVDFWPLAHTTLYEEPARLEKLGYLTSQLAAGGRRRRIYTATAKGREELRRWRDDPAATAPRLHDEGWLKAFAAGDLSAMQERALQCVQINGSVIRKALGRTSTR